MMKLVIVLLLLLFIGATDGVSIPMMYTKGTHYQIGHDIGQTFSQRIQEFFSLHPLLNSVLVPWSNQPEGKAIVDGFLASLTEAFPWIVEEMKGIAEGANVTFNQVFVMNLNMEISALINTTQGQPPQRLVDKDESGPCSDVFVNYPDSQQVIIGHNEDTSPLIKTRGYFVNAEVVDTSNGETIIKQKFTAYSYPGVVPGNAFGFNHHGLITTVNALYPKLVSKKKIGRYFLTRALLAAATKEEAERIMEMAGGYGAAYGFSVNMGILKGNSSGEIWNFENAPLVDKLKTDTNGNQVPPGKWSYHVNKYRRETVEEIPEKIISSLHRTARIEEFSPTGIEDIKTILGDTKDKDYPLYRAPSATDPGCTVATALFDLLRCKVDIYLDNPKSSEATFTLPLPCGQ